MAYASIQDIPKAAMAAFAVTCLIFESGDRLECENYEIEAFEGYDEHAGHVILRAVSGGTIIGSELCIPFAEWVQNEAVWFERLADVLPEWA